MLKKPAKIVLDAKDQAALKEQGRKQQLGQKSVDSYNPEFPVFKIPANERVLVYVPNRRNEDGTFEMSVAAAHSVRVNGTFSFVRCIQNIEGVADFDGSCPLCDAMGQMWEKYRLELDSIIIQKGLNKDDAGDAEIIKSISKELLSKFELKNPDKYVTFPIVVVESEAPKKGRGLVPKYNEDGTVNAKVYFYTAKEDYYKDHWEVAFESVVGEDVEDFGGRWVMLNYQYETDPSKVVAANALRDSAKSMKAVLLPTISNPEVEAKLEELASTFTSDVVEEELVKHVWRTKEELTKLTAEIVAPVEKYLLLQEGAMLGKAIGVSAQQGVSVPAAAVEVNQSAENALKNFADGV